MVISIFQEGLLVVFEVFSVDKFNIRTMEVSKSSSNLSDINFLFISSSQKFWSVGFENGVDNDSLWLSDNGFTILEIREIDERVVDGGFCFNKPFILVGENFILVFEAEILED